MTSRMSILRVKNVIKSHENVLADFLTRLKQSEFDTNTTRVKHLQENITELQKKYDQLTLNVKVSVNVQQANLDTVQTSINRVRYAQYFLWKALKLPLLKVGSPSVTQKEKIYQAEPQHVLNRLILTLRVLNHAGGTTVHEKIYSKD
ncbi:hypothetical protein ACS0TY_009706 [Phlomoides rotata]